MERNERFLQIAESLKPALFEKKVGVLETIGGEDYRSRSFLTGREIVFSMGNETFSGTVTGISDEAHLLVRLENGEERAFSAGEVQIHKGFQKA